MNNPLKQHFKQSYGVGSQTSGIYSMSSLNRIVFAIILTVLSICNANAQVDSIKKIQPFIAYEFGEAFFNKFQSISGEAGVLLNNRQSIRLVHMNVNLTEEHLSSDFAGAIDGDSIEGNFLGFELFYDFPVLLEGLQISPSLGYYKNEYSHLGDEGNFSNTSWTIGAAISYTERDIFKVNGLYYRLSIPMRTPFNPISETKLGNGTINNNQFDNNIWLFLGYQF